MNKTEALPEIFQGVNELIARHFYNISQIPRESGNEAGVREYGIDWAKERNFEYRTDDVGNLAIDIPATPGYEKKDRVIPQAHMDMICVQVPEGTHNFEKDPIELACTGDFIHSKGNKTTVGADDDAGLAISLALVEDPECVHGPLTILWTVDEEKGMSGALNLGSNMIPNDTDKKIHLLNLDAEEGEHEIANGSAAGSVTFAEMDLTDHLEDIQPDYKVLKIELKGLLGRHSGTEVHEGDGNAIVFLGLLLNNIQTKVPNFQLISFNGGENQSKIPPSGYLEIALAEKDIPLVKELVDTMEANIIDIIGDEKSKKLIVETHQLQLEAQKAVVNETRTQIAIVLLKLANLDGVRIAEGPKHPKVSTTTGIVETKDNKIRIVNHYRASMDMLDRLHGFTKYMREYIASHGFNIIEGGNISEGQSGDYPGWQEPDDSEIVKAAKKAHTNLYGNDANVFAYHAGVEVGAIKGKVEESTSKEVSSTALGPLILDAHSEQERVSKPSMNEAHKLAKETLRILAEDTPEPLAA